MISRNYIVCNQMTGLFTLKAKKRIFFCFFEVINDGENFHIKSLLMVFAKPE